MNIAEIEAKLAQLQRKLAQQEDEIARLRGEPHKSVSDKPWQKMDYTANFGMHPNVVAEMCRAVPDSVLADIVGDARRASQAVPRTPAVDVERGTGWTDEPKNRDRSREFELIDDITKAMVGGPNDTRKLK
jgi:hypothetical protein